MNFYSLSLSLSDIVKQNLQCEFHISKNILKYLVIHEKKILAEKSQIYTNPSKLDEVQQNIL